MSIEVYADVIAPNSLFSATVRGRHMRMNTRVRFGSGEMQINVANPLTLRQFTIGTVPMRVEVWATLEGLYEVTDAGAYGFLMEDPHDCIAVDASGFLWPYTTALVGAIGVGFGVPGHKLYKRQTSAGSTRTKDRAITRPNAATLIVKRNGSPVTMGAAPGNAALAATTGTVTFVADDTSAAASITPGATTQVVLASSMGMIATQRLYLSGFAGVDAALLNGLSHVINSISGSAPATFTLATNTLGATITLGAGSGARYPQASETLTWSGRFYVPVHFENDDLDWELIIAGQADARMFAGPSVVLTEVRE